MIYISHRGNLTGPQPQLENTPDYISEALSKGYFCEVDVFAHHGKLWLGHDDAQTETTVQFLKRSGIIAHAKNLDALAILLKEDVHCFFHNTDDYTITSKGWIWAYPNVMGTTMHACIAVLPEQNNTDVSNFTGICSDYLENYKNDQTNSV